MTARTAMPRSGEPRQPRPAPYEADPYGDSRPEDGHDAGDGSSDARVDVDETSSGQELDEESGELPGDRSGVAGGDEGRVEVYEAGSAEPAHFEGFAVDEDRAQQFTIRASQKVHGGLAIGAGLVAIGFATSASTSATGILRWIAAAGFGVLAVVCARALTVGDMLVADQVGIRLRIRNDWIGTRWEEIEEVTVLRRRHPLDDGRIAVHLLDPGPVLSEMSAKSRRTTDANRRLTGSSLAVPFGVTAKPSNGEVVQALHMLADARCPVREQL
ncbi:hypothetical protein FB561_4758 [Kribbella amoyensis]|uniref:Uncharacterized protein n=1 Tax=Kribbella amoyensis TaxID=996641 RepID=A0A561BXY9_9ACTN|nr:hypothetical protein [Kribbella amoyensis]TWD83592.1 hypothetical protein FB561_4758 [Kribbella amoyensis]